MPRRHVPWIGPMRDEYPLLAGVEFQERYLRRFAAFKPVHRRNNCEEHRTYARQKDGPGVAPPTGGRVCLGYLRRFTPSGGHPPQAAKWTSKHDRPVRSPTRAANILRERTDRDR